MPTLRTAERFCAVSLVPASLERADEAVLLLRQAFAEGRGRDHALTDSKLVPLWGHEQFRRLVALMG